MTETETEAPPAGAEANGSGDPDDARIEELILQAPDGQLGFAVGGKQPTSSSLTIVGGKIGVSGQFRKGGLFKVEGVIRIAGVAFEDKIDSKTGQAVSCDRKQKARIVELQVTAPAEGGGS